jgi:hypothetical protein
MHAAQIYAEMLGVVLRKGVEDYINGMKDGHQEVCSGTFTHRRHLFFTLDIPHVGYSMPDSRTRISVISALTVRHTRPVSRTR